MNGTVIYVSIFSFSFFVTKFKRLQFLESLISSTILNRAQGQSFKITALNLNPSYFSYAAFIFFSKISFVYTNLFGLALQTTL